MFPLGRWWGVPVSAHPGYLSAGFVLALFLHDFKTGAALLGFGLCVASLAAHELCHALAARRLGYKVYGVCLHPFRPPTAIRERLRSEHEPRIALAGPLVSTVLLGVFWALTVLMSRSWLGAVAGSGLRFNGMLLGLSLLPVLPQDVGVALRGALATRMGARRATELLGRIGLTLAALAGLVAIWLRLPWLGALGAAAMTGTMLSVRTELAKLSLSVASVEDAMATDFATLSPGDTLAQVMERHGVATGRDFPVVQGDDVLGVLRSTALLSARTARQRRAYVASAMDREVAWAEASEPLAEVISRVRDGELLPILVRRDDALVGMLTASLLQKLNLSGK